MDALLHGAQYRKDHELCYGIKGGQQERGDGIGNQIYQLPKKPF